jgi:hypothetical protein
MAGLIVKKKSQWLILREEIEYYLSKHAYRSLETRLLCNHLIFLP